MTGISGDSSKRRVKSAKKPKSKPSSLAGKFTAKQRSASKKPSTSRTSRPDPAVKARSGYSGVSASKSKKAFSSKPRSQRRSREDSKNLTAQQSQVSESITGDSTSNDRPVSYFTGADSSPGTKRALENANVGTRSDDFELPSGRTLGQVREEARQDEQTRTEEGRTSGRTKRAIENDELLNRLPEEDRRAIEEGREADRERFINNLPEEDRQAIQEGEQINDITTEVARADSPEEQIEIINEHLESGDVDAQRLLESAAPEVLESLGDADQAVVSETFEDFSAIVGEDEEVAELLAEQITENPPRNFNGVVGGLATASADGNSELAVALAEDLREAEVPAAEAVQQAAELEGVVNDVRSTVQTDNLSSTLEATESITAAIDGAPPEVAQALLAELDDNGSLGRITANLREPALDQDSSSLYLSQNADLLAPLEEGQNIGSRQEFDRVVAQLSNAVSVAGSDETTGMVAERISGVIGDDIGRFDEAFRLSVGKGHGAGLAGEVATQLHERGEVGSSANLVEGIEKGAETFLRTFDGVADKVDESNGDLSYLMAQWAPFYGDSEAGQAALAEQVQTFQEGRPEYQELNELSTNVGQDLEVLRDLQDLFPEKQHLKDHELSLLGEATRFGNTENGRRALAGAVERSGMGEQSFVDRFMDDDVRESLSDGDLKDLGFENYDQFKETVGQHTINGTLGVMAEAAQSGDDYKLEMLGDGLVNQSEFLGENPSTVRGVVDAYNEITAQSYKFTEKGGAIAQDRLQNAINGLDDVVGDIRNPATAAKLRIGAGTLGFLAGGFAWHSALSDGNVTFQEGVGALAPTLEGVFGGLEQFSEYRGGALFGRNSQFFSRGAKVFAGAGLLLDGIGVVTNLREGNHVQAGISAIGVAGSAATLLGATGVGLGLGLGAAALGLAYGQYSKVKASNRFESEEAERFIAGALEQNGVTGDADQIGDITHHLRNADDEGRQTGILIQQAAERGNIPPGDLLAIIAQNDPGTILNIVETGHGIDPTDSSLDSLPQTADSDENVGQRVGHRRNRRIQQPRSVEGFLVWLQQQGHIERGTHGHIVLD